MPAIYEHRHRVAAGEIDGWGHANNVEYLKWNQSAAIAHSAVQGWAPAAYHEIAAGWVVRSHQIEYKSPAFEGDELIIRTWVASMGRATSSRRFEILRASDGVLLATAVTEWAFVSRSTGRPTRIPPEVAAAFEIVEERAAG
jgi:acyl-CoA thioester hydrolase